MERSQKKLMELTGVSISKMRNWMMHTCMLRFRKRMIQTKI